MAEQEAVSASKRPWVTPSDRTLLQAQLEKKERELAKRELMLKEKELQAVCAPSCLTLLILRASLSQHVAVGAVACSGLVATLTHSWIASRPSGPGTKFYAIQDVGDGRSLNGGAAS